jgi:radical SAM superfamily enzyme YgiQ (UPF0313 family)
LAAYLREHNPEIELAVLDCRALELGEDEMIAHVGRIKPEIIYLGDILHTTGGAAIIYRYNQAAQTIKENYPAIKIIVGGLYYSALPRETLAQNPAIDYVIVGEGEITISELLKEIVREQPALTTIKGLAYRDGSHIVLNEPRPLIEDLDQLPIPAYDLFPMDKYVGYTYIKPYTETWNSRGCPAGCVFCYEWSQFDPRSRNDLRNYRARSGKLVAQEMEILAKDYGLHSVVMMDDAFNVRRERVIEFCQEMIGKELGLQWIMLGRAPNYIRDRDLFPLMKEAGAAYCLVGLEVATDEELKALKKGITTTQVAQTIADLRKAGIASIVTWMIGFWEDSEEVIRERFRFIDQIDPDIMALQVLNPMPGSPLWDHAHEQGLIEIKDLSQWDFHRPVMPTKYLSREKLSELGAWALQEFYQKEGRIERVFKNPDYAPIVRVCFKSYLDNAANFEKAIKAEEVFV